MLAYPVDGSVQGPCPPEYRYFGKPSCGCSAHDCRPGPELAARLPNRTAAAPSVADFLRATFTETVYLFGAETTGSTPAIIKGNWVDVQATAIANGWSGPVSIVEITHEKDYGEEISRRVIGTLTV